MRCQFLFPCRLRAMQLQDAHMGGNVHWRLLGAGQVHKLHMACVRAREARSELLLLGHRTLRPLRVIAGFKGVQLMGIMCECKHFDHRVQNNHNSIYFVTQHDAPEPVENSISITVFFFKVDADHHFVRRVFWLFPTTN